MKQILFVLVLLAAGGCAHQDYGVSNYKLNKDGTFTVASGKETAKVEAVMQRDGEKQFVYFQALDVRAFEGQAIGADVAMEITNAVREVLPQLVSDAVKAALGTKALDGMLLVPPTTLPAQ